MKLVKLTGAKITSYFSPEIELTEKNEQLQNELYAQLDPSIKGAVSEMIDINMPHCSTGGINLSMGKTFLITYEVMQASWRRYIALITSVKEITPEEAFRLIENENLYE